MSMSSRLRRPPPAEAQHLCWRQRRRIVVDRERQRRRVVVGRQQPVSQVHVGNFATPFPRNSYPSTRRGRRRSAYLLLTKE